MRGFLRDTVMRCAEQRCSACNGRPANLLILHCFKISVRTENHGVGSSILPLGINDSKPLARLVLA